VKVYLATSGEYSDYSVLRVFARREDAEAYRLADRVEEYELTEGPADVRPRWHLQWIPGIPDRETTEHALENPHVWSYDQDFNSGIQPIFHRWYKSAQPGPPPRLDVEGWDRERVMKVYSEQRAQHEAAKAGL